MQRATPWTATVLDLVKVSIIMGALFTALAVTIDATRVDPADRNALIERSTIERSMRG